LFAWDVLTKKLRFATENRTSKNRALRLHLGRTCTPCRNAGHRFELMVTFAGPAGRGNGIPSPPVCVRGVNCSHRRAVFIRLRLETEAKVGVSIAFAHLAVSKGLPALRFWRLKFGFRGVGFQVFRPFRNRSTHGLTAHVPSR
jgi:hypothetical protein